MVIFYVYMRERAKKSPFYVAYTQIGNLCIRNLRMRRKKLRKPSYAYMRISLSARPTAKILAVRGLKKSSFGKSFIPVPTVRMYVGCTRT